MNLSLFPSLNKSVCFFSLLVCLTFSSQLLAQRNAPVAGDAALLTDLLKKDYNTLDPDVRLEQLAKDRTIVIGTLKRYLTDKQQDSLSSKTNNDKIERSFMEHKQAEQELAIYNNKFGKSITELDTIRNLVNRSDKEKKSYYALRYNLDSMTFIKLTCVFKIDNQYLSYISDAFFQKYKTLQSFQDDQYAEASQESSVQKALPFIGGDLAFEVIIDGLSKFLAERIKEELTVAVIERVQEYLRNPKEGDPLAELKVLLPRTQQYLLSFKASQMVNFPDEIKQYIEDDLKHLPDNLSDLGKTPRIQRLVKQHPELDFALEALEFIPNLAKIKNPVDFFDLLENSRNISRWANDTSMLKCNLANTLRLSSLLAHSLTVVDNGELRMAGADFLNAYGSEVPFYLMYVGFLHQQNIKYYNIQFKSDTKLWVVKMHKKSGAKNENKEERFIRFSDLTSHLVNVVHFSSANELKVDSIKHKIDENLKDAQGTFFFFKDLFATIGADAEKVYASAQLIKKARKNGEVIGPDTLYAFIDDMIHLTQDVVLSADSLCSRLMLDKRVLNNAVFLEIDSAKIPIKYTFNTKTGSLLQELNLHEKVLPYLSVARTTNELVYDLQQKKYATALIKALEITADLWPNELLQQQPKYLQETLTLFPHKGYSTGQYNWRKELRKDWHAKSWSAILGYINGAKPNDTIKNKKKSAEIVLSELQNIQRYSKNNYLKYSSEFWGKFNLLLQAVDDISNESTFSIDLVKVKNFLKDDSLKRLVLSYYVNRNLEEWTEHVKIELKERKFITHADSKAILDSMNRYIAVTFNYLVDGDRPKFNASTESFAKTVRKFLIQIPESPSFHLNEQTIQIIHFVNDMAKAENSDDVKSAIEAFALPAGSYSIKREEKFNISLNSYPGIMGSFETTWRDKTAYATGTGSFTAPIGLNLGWGAKNGGSNSLFLSVIDVGAFTRMYLVGKDLDSTLTDSVSTYTVLPEFTFMNLFSPGAYYVHGFRKTPLSLYAGFQWGPSLREVKREDNEIKTVNNYNSMRFSIGLVLDIPLWNIHTKPRL